MLKTIHCDDLDLVLDIIPGAEPPIHILVNLCNIYLTVCNYVLGCLT